MLRCILFVACLCHAAHGQVDVKVANKTIQRLQGQVEAKEQEVGALNIKVCSLGCPGICICSLAVLKPSIGYKRVAASDVGSKGSREH